MSRTAITACTRTAPGVPRPVGAAPRRRGWDPQFLDLGTGLPTADNTHEVATGRTTTAELDTAGATTAITGLEDLRPLRALLR